MPAHPLLQNSFAQGKQILPSPEARKFKNMVFTIMTEGVVDRNQIKITIKPCEIKIYCKKGPVLKGFVIHN